MASKELARLLFELGSAERLAVLDDQAGLCLPSTDGRLDMAAMLLVTDAEGCRWCEDLFLSLWSRAEVLRAPMH